MRRQQRRSSGKGRSFMLLLKEIIEATGGEVISRGPESFRSLSIDSRTVREGELFLCLRGKRFDGHDFLQDALKICGGAVVENPEKISRLSLKGQRTIILVQDTLRSLWSLATFFRKRIKTVTGITGSNGKTTTKEMLWKILSLEGSALKNDGNYNNEIGLPFSIINKVAELPADEAIDHGVFEMGASKRGDIKLLSEIARPEYGLITNIGHAHLEGMGGIEGVFRTKTEIADFVKVLFVNGDDQYLKRLNQEKKVITFGLDRDSSVRAEEIRIEETHSHYRLIVDMKARDFSDIEIDTEITLNIPGMGNIYNSLGAGAVALYLGVPVEIVKAGLEEFRGVKLRLEIVQIDGVTFIVDAYNANPDSMKNAIRELIRFKKGRAIAVLGDMLELGTYSSELHRELGRHLNAQGVDIFLAVGPEMKKAAEEVKDMEVFIIESSEEAGRVLLDIVRPGDTVLIKGSRLMAMEKIMDIFKDHQRGKPL